MLPKARGKASTRPRSRGRGHDTASRSAVDAGEPNEAASGSSEAVANPVISKEGHGVDAKISTSEANDAAAPASLTSSAELQSSESSHVQRPASLSASTSSSHPTSSSVRGRTSMARGRKGMVKPTFTGRRSKEEREALAKEQREKDSMRNAERDAAMRRKEQDEAYRMKREARHALRARGGHNTAVSGPFSLGSSREHKKLSHHDGGYSTFGLRSGSQASRIKHESDNNAGPSQRAGASGMVAKSEHSALVSSDEEDSEFPRKDIDLIEVFEENDHETSPKPRPARTALPVRIGRKEHQERTFGINTEASTEAPKGTAEQLDAANQQSASISSQQAVRKGKGKAKMMETIHAREPFRGVWQDAEDDPAALKPEAATDEESMKDARWPEGTEPLSHITKGLETSPLTAERSTKTKTKKTVPLALQTEEDWAEWARFQKNLQHIRLELGPEEIPAPDVTGDTPMVDDASNNGKPTVRDNCVYLFQLPPLMPDLLVSNIKKEDQETQPNEPVISPQKPETKVKVEDKGDESFFNPGNGYSSGPRFASGSVGKLRVRQSGRTTMDWGGTSYELNAANQASFLQEVVSVKIVPEKERALLEDAGEAVSLGRIKGKFVVVPDWESVLG